MALIQLDRTDAFEVLYDRHCAAVHRLACRYVGAGSAAEDVTQETFIGAWRARQQFACERGNARGWLLTIARNRAVDALRRGARQNLAFDESYDPAGPDCVETETFSRERAGEIAGALRLLPVEQRDVIELAFAAGMTHPEIAAQLQIPLGTVKSRARLGLNRLRFELSPLHVAA
ncbi:RNA polymerase sigma factor [Solirubrobacter pauli]|nr:sigma-70 family RNA polymerase sigma factor [Solirubrobacter pauli]